MPLRVALPLAAASGFVALSYEIVWYRVFSFVSWGSPVVFGLLLAFYLFGVALGARWAERRCDGAPAERVARWAARATFAATIFSFLLVPCLARLVTVMPWVAALGLVAIGSGTLGAVFPLLTHLAVPPDHRAGQGVSYIYLANIVGSAGGSLITGFVLFDHLTTQGVSIVLALAGLATAAAIALTTKVWDPIRGIASVTAVAVFLIVTTPLLFDRLYDRLQFREKFSDDARLAEVVENRNGVVTVTPDGRVFGGGAYDGAFNTSVLDDMNGVMRAYAMIAMRPEAESVLMIGLGSGSWAQIFAHAPNVKHLTVVEINPAYEELLARHEDVASLRTNPKVDIVIADGRQWLMQHRDRFDLIVANTTWHWRAHATGLLSEEFHGLVREHLEPGGAYYFNATGSDDVLKTGASGFAHALRVQSFLAASDAPLVLREDAMRRTLVNFRIDGKPILSGSGEENARALARGLALVGTENTDDAPYAYVLETGPHILARTADAQIVTDDNMVSEWRKLYLVLPGEVASLDHATGPE